MNRRHLAGVFPAVAAVALAFATVRSAGASSGAPPEAVAPAPVVAVATTVPAVDVATTSAERGGVSAALEAAAGRSGLRSEVLHLALRAYARAVQEGLATRPIVTVVDYSRPSREQRLWVLDLSRDSVLARELVAHGNKSGGDVATSFSNREGSHQTSLGTFVTAGTYTGKHGLSLRLKGLDAGLNDQAMRRAIVVHGADYVSEKVIPVLGRLGRSQGCPALTRAAAPRIIDLIRDGTVFFAYHPSGDLERTLPPAETTAL
jgi:hypothetical protein